VNWNVARSHLIALAALWLLVAAPLSADDVPVHYKEGVVHGFLLLRSEDGKAIADGDLIQTVRGELVTTRLVFRFKDGSVHDETAVFSQRRQFRLITDHLVQKGPAFQHPTDVTIEVPKRRVTVHTADDDGKEKNYTDEIQFPADLANGMILTILKNVRPTATQTQVSMVAVTPKPRMVKLAITPVGTEPFSVGSSGRKAIHYVVKIEIGGIAGIVAPVLGKQPPETHVWILGGEAPAFIKSTGPLYNGGPIWQIELTSPVWPQKPAAESKN
jgi:hypothetical protein